MRAGTPDEPAGEDAYATGSSAAVPVRLVGEGEDMPSWRQECRGEARHWPLRTVTGSSIGQLFLRLDLAGDSQRKIEGLLAGFTADEGEQFSVHALRRPARAAPVEETG